MFSIYTSAYNLNKMSFDWKPILDNWASFLNGYGEIVIAVNTSEDDTYGTLLNHAWDIKNRGSAVEWKIFKTEIPYSDPLFDGKIKDEALKKCTSRYCILLDMDEVVPLWTRNAWMSAAAQIEQTAGAEAALIPSIDLFHNENNYRSLGGKWYLHLNQPHIGRGAVGFARRGDGTIDINKSDSTELINRDSLDLIRYVTVIDPRLSDHLKLEYIKSGHIPLVVHLGWLNKEQRVRQSAFWTPVWNAREGKNVERAKTMAELESIEYRSHGLNHWSRE